MDDSQLDFEGEWGTGGLSFEYNQTVSLSHTRGSTATMQFNGESDFYEAQGSG